ncbi:hypothetical protein BGLT_02258 [Caballeronia glathei]|uniref:Uncharacterized protein n=1 Tax=Caballeronia glathei TaxID=60547 RepID=A0A069PNU1_9BURK|nr:hypothetical protein [Caballeronia glathei]KDR41544.1 hypothetical protein BG61_16745 [Caballeronia glathei]CDY79477.1 hypothetical protein BGLT_02258 [Caballeronia glathei]
MPQGPIAVNPISNTQTKLNVTAKTVINVGPGRVAKIVFVVASTAGTPGVYDAATTAAGVAATALWAGAAVTTIGTVVPLDMAYTNGLVVDPGTTGVVSVSFI